jgi:hypothetical protein
MDNINSEQTLRVIKVDKDSVPGRLLLTLCFGDKQTILSTPADGQSTDEDRSLVTQAHRELGMI